MKNVHELPLVLMEPLDLDVEHGFGVHGDAGAALQPLGQPVLVAVFGLCEPPAEGGVVGQRLEIPQALQVAHPPLADGLGQEVPQRVIAAVEPAPGRDPVGLVDDAFGVQRVQLAEDLPLHQFGVKRRDAVHAARTDEGQFPHAYFAVGDHPDGIGTPQRTAMMRVDAFDELHVPGQDSAHHFDRPAFQRLRQQGVVGVVETGAGDLVGVAEALPVVVDQQPDQLREGDGRVGVVELNGHCPGQSRDIVMMREKPAQEVGDRGGGEEILLLQPQLPSRLGGVIGVEHPADVLRQDRGGGGGHVVAPAERFEIEFPHRLGGPQAQRVGPAPAPAGNWRVVSDGQHAFLRRPGLAGSVSAY